MSDMKAIDELCALVKDMGVALQSVHGGISWLDLPKLAPVFVDLKDFLGDMKDLPGEVGGLSKEEAAKALSDVLLAAMELAKGVVGYKP